MDRSNSLSDRRNFLCAVSLGGLALAACNRASTREAEVTPGEDLMQEHGVIRRVLLVYEEAARRIESNEQLDLTLVGRAAAIIRRFAEDYHERMEERHVFIVLERAKRDTQLVSTLRAQHERGRQVTDDITRRVSGPSSPELARALRGFSRMYRPHASWEDTVVFPAFRSLLGRKAYEELGEQFEEKEHTELGSDGFAVTLAEVGTLETALGIGELAKMTQS